MAPALITGTATTAAAAPPGAATGILTVGGEANDPDGPGADTNLWRFYGDAYTSLRAELIEPGELRYRGNRDEGALPDPRPRGSTRSTQRGSPTRRVLRRQFPGAVGIRAESAALETFVRNGGGLVLNAQPGDFGDLPDVAQRSRLTLAPPARSSAPASARSRSARARTVAVDRRRWSHPRHRRRTVRRFRRSPDDVPHGHRVDGHRQRDAALQRQHQRTRTAVRHRPTPSAGDANGINFTIETTPINGSLTSPASPSRARVGRVPATPLGAPIALLPATASPGPPRGLAVGPHTLIAVATWRRAAHPAHLAIDVNVVADARRTVALDVDRRHRCPGAQGEVVNNNLAARPWPPSSPARSASARARSS